jgi:hypothetical protein
VGGTVCVSGAACHTAGRGGAQLSWLGTRRLAGKLYNNPLLTEPPTTKTNTRDATTHLCLGSGTGR